MKLTKSKLREIIKEEILRKQSEKRKLTETSNEVWKSYEKIFKLIRKESKRLNDDDTYELSTKIKEWFNKNVL